jgi:hypothetical protein
MVNKNFGKVFLCLEPELKLYYCSGTSQRCRFLRAPALAPQHWNFFLFEGWNVYEFQVFVVNDCLFF